MPRFPMEIKLFHVHNHSLESADVLKYRDVSSEVRETFVQLFSEGYNPAAALEFFKYNLQIEHQNEYYKLCADRAIVPDYPWCSRLYKEIKEKVYGNNETALDKVKALIEAANSKQTTMKMIVTEQGKSIIAICTPLMQRVLKHVEQSGELCFVDSSGNMDRDNHRVFLVMTHCPAGGLPVGCFITEDESENTIRTAFELYKEIIPNEGFNKRGQQGPLYFMTDDSAAERKAIMTSFPNATLFLCTFHVLQAVWRWLWQSKNKIQKESRPELFNLFKRMMYCDSEKILEKFYQELIQRAKELKCEKYSYYIAKLYTRKQEWALCHRNEKLIRNNNTNNYCEAAIRVVKDKVLYRWKAFNIVQLCHFITERMEKFYQRRLADIALNRFVHATHSKYLPHCGDINLDAIEKISDYLYTVPSEKENKKKKKEPIKRTYAVNMDIGLCTCHLGSTGGPCKHQCAVAAKFKIVCKNIIPIHSAKLCQDLLFVATGEVVEMTMFESLRQEESQTLIGNASLSVQESTDSAESELLPLQTSQENKDKRISRALNGFKEITELLRNEFVNDPDQFLPAFESFIETASHFKTGAAICQALHMFGKDFSRFTSSVKIPIQSSSVSHRVSAIPVSGATSSSISGRPPKRLRTEEHAYHQAKGKKISAAPHNLSECVTQNKSLGK